MPSSDTAGTPNPPDPDPADPCGETSRANDSTFNDIDGDTTNRASNYVRSASDEELATRHRERRPRKPETLRDQIHNVWFKVEALRSRHEVLAGRYSVIASWARLVTALGATLSTASVIANNRTFTLIFTVITAIVAALNAGFNPPEASTAHREAAKAYGRCQRPLGELLYAIDSYGVTSYVQETLKSENRPYDTGYYETTYGLTTEDMARMWDEFCNCNDEVEAIDERAPSLNRLRQYDVDVLEEEIPQTYLGMLRYRRALKYRIRANELRAEANEKLFSSRRRPDDTVRSE